MRHNVDGRQLSRNTSHRIAMLKNLANSVILDEVVTTTVPKAKEVRGWVDRLITLGKNGTLASRRLAFSRTRNSDVVGKLFSTLAQRYQNRPGGYTRILKLALTRRGDGADMAVIELVDRPELNRSRADHLAATQGNKKEKSEKTQSASGGVLDPLKKAKRAFSGKKTRPVRQTAAGTEAQADKPKKTKKASTSKKKAASP